MHTSVIDQLPIDSLKGTRVMVRVDTAQDIQESLPTLQYLLAAKSRLIVAADGELVRSDSDVALTPLADELRRLLHRPVKRLSEAVGKNALRTILTAGPEDILLIESLALYAEEAANDPAFARQLASLCEIYCNDALGLAQRSLASTVGITRYTRIAVSGLSMARELAKIEAVTDQPELPSVGIVCGVDLEERLPLLEHLSTRVGRLFLVVCVTQIAH